MPSEEEWFLYAAENQVGAEFGPSRAAWRYLSFLAAWRHLRRRLTDHDAIGYVSYVMRQPWFTGKFPGVGPVAVQLVPGPSWCDPRHDRVIRLGSSSRRTLQAAEWDLLHELAHIVTPAPPGIPGVTSLKGGDAPQRHGDAWKDNYIFLIQNMLGPRAARHLAAAIKPDPAP
jgi:hypothetical protein